jgi:formiminotetrahydrofolate cyclodeaminase
MRDETVGDWLDRLASAQPAPGGGAAAAPSAALAAALLEMVANLTIGKPKFAAYEPVARAVLEQAQQLRVEAIELAEHDTAAFTTLMASLRLPKDTAREREHRTNTIRGATLAAARVPLRIAEVAATTIELAERLREHSNPRVLTDVGVAVASALAALQSAALNVRVNLTSLDDADAAPLRATLDTALAATETARTTAAAVRSAVGE